MKGAKRAVTVVLALAAVLATARFFLPPRTLTEIVLTTPVMGEIAYAAREFIEEGVRDAPVCPAVSDADAPNVILIAVDSLRADRIAPYGDAATPHLAGLASDSIVYEWAFSSAPWTTPAFAGVFTGQHPLALGIGEKPAPVPDGTPTLAALLCAAGYRTEGVVSHIYVGRKFGFTRGFERWDQSLARGHDFVSSPRVTDRAIERLTGRGDPDRPFFLFVHYFDPHYDYIEHADFKSEGRTSGEIADEDGNLLPIETLRELGEQGRLQSADIEDIEGRYDSEVRFTDHHIGRLLDALRSERLYDDSIVIFLADHGEMLGRRAPAHWVGHTKYLWNELTRVPLFIKLPGQHRKERIAIPVSTIDVLPTVLDAIGSSAISGEPPRSRSLLRAAGELSRPVFAQTRRSLSFDTVIRGSHKLIWDADQNAPALYDYAADPGEKHDLHRQLPAVVRSLTEELETWRHEVERRAAGRAPAPDVELTPQEREQLEQLGYID